jgi:hypothetical protein
MRNALKVKDRQKELRSIVDYDADGTSKGRLISGRLPCGFSQEMGAPSC